jgi:hypothetical protein
MKPLLAMFAVCLALSGARAEGTAAARRDFLLGMAGTGLVVGAGGLEGFWPTEQAAAILYESVAKRYARDIGVEASKLASGEWKSAVAASLRPSKEEDSMAYLAGAFARWGTSNGFSVAGSQKGYEVARRVSDLNRFDVQLVHQAGYPGRTVITVSDGGESQSAELFKILRGIAAEIGKEPNQSLQPTAPSRRG